ncbi:MAG: FecR domain-containing protein [Kiritimatiellae bacterium]|nr:FecR domain-containing protein [Kiritimatiellia bacterium]
MTAKPLLSLVSEYLDGQLAPEAHAELLARAQQDPAQLAVIRKQILISELLEQQFSPKRARETFVAELQKRLPSDQSGVAFVRELTARLDAVEKKPARRPAGMPTPRPHPRVRTRRGRAPSRAALTPRLRQRPGRPFVGLWITAVAASVLVLLGLLFGRVLVSELGRHTVPPVAQVATVQAAAGDVRLWRGGQACTVAVGSGLLLADRLQTRAPAGRVTVRYPDGTELALEPETEISFQPAGAAGGRRLEMRVGRLLATVTPRTPPPTYLTTPHAELRVLGTRFTVAVTTRATRIDMQDGRLEVAARARPGQPAIIGRGEYAVVTDTIHTGQIPGTNGKAAPVRPGVMPGLQVLYTFREGRGAVVHDVSGTDTPLDLEAEDPAAFRWIPGGGLELRAPARFVSRQPATQLVRACRAGNAFTVEAWVQPTAFAHLGESPARIVTLRAPAENEGGFVLGLKRFATEPPAYVVRLQTLRTPTLLPEILSAPGLVARNMDHVVFAREPSGRARFFVNGIERAERLHPGNNKATPWAGTFDGDFANWSDTLLLVLGSRAATVPGHAWIGRYYLVAVYSRALSASEIENRFHAGLNRNAGNGT